MTSIDKILISRLEKNGVETSLIPGFFRSLANALLINPGMTLRQANKRLKYLGWCDIELDYQTLLLARLCFEAKGLKSLEYRSAPWYAKAFQSCDSSL
ncbi:MAG: hypothetical protein GY737_11190 [Desulfobacteraceae bacterium]|nr:hypothetical protein [Desulfobacteraceae bacterium]